LKQVGLSVTGLACLDVGQSTGGFTDCLLQHGAASVVGVDVGSAQLHPSLREDPRVLCVEKVNARSLVATDLIAAYAYSTGAEGQFDSEDDEDDEEVSVSEFVPEFDLIVADLSFISQTLVLPAVLAFLKTGGTLLTLVKPQFELQPGQVGKGGIVKDDAMYPLVEQRLREACADLGLTVTAWFDSPIDGGDGNREFFICARKNG
jgi:23S rRNA (cytidine1920-2'-O)/16S rRNA (cytidine1409-2'-O)-methyltransferase